MINPADVEALYVARAIAPSRGTLPDAADVSRRALELDPAHREARYVHATALIRMGNTDEGAAEMQVFQRLQAEDGEARARVFELGRLRREASVSLAAGDARQRRHVAATCAGLRPSFGDLSSRTRASRSSRAARRPRRSNVSNTAAALNAPFDVHRHLAKAYAALGRKDESQNEQATYERLRRESISRTGRAR